MAGPILSFPFRIVPAGNVAVVDQDSEGADQEQIAVLILTRTGERPLAPGFGIPDPVFVGIDPAAITNGIRLYGPPVQAAVTISQADEVTQTVTVTF